MVRRPTLALTLALLAIFPSLVGADSLFVAKSHTDAFEVAGQKQAAKDSQVKTWVSGDKLRRDDGDQSVIFRPDLKLVYLVDHDAKTYSELALPIDLKKMMPPGSEAMADQIAEGMKVTVQVTAKDDTRKVNQWNAKRYDVAVQSAMGMKINTTLWVSKEVEGYAAMNRLAAAMASLQPGSAAWVRELERIDGYPVLQESQVDALGAKFGTREELVSVETKAAPAGSFEPPAGYKAEPYNPIAGMAR